MGQCNTKTNISVPKRNTCELKPGSSDQIKDKYLIKKKTLGKGSFGRVFLAINSENKDVKMAIKTICKKELDDKMIAKIKTEVKVVQKLDHPNIVKYLETFENEKYLYLVMEHCEGGELFERLKDYDNGIMAEKECANIMRQLFLAINHCHSKGVIHRDLKMENIMYKKREISENPEIKLIDFGLSKETSKHRLQMKTTCGSPYYVAPEILSQSGYGKECDIWSLGVIMYMLLSGGIPFNGTSVLEIFESIQQNEVRFEAPQWDNVSDEAKDFIRKCLNKNKNKRITAAKALKSKWFKKYFKESSEQPSEEVVESIINYNG